MIGIGAEWGSIAVYLGNQLLSGQSNFIANFPGTYTLSPVDFGIFFNF